MAFAEVPPIPLRLLPDSCEVRAPDGAGGFMPAREIRRVRAAVRASWSSSAHRLGGCSGVLYVDAANSIGAFEVPAGSRVSVRGNDYLAASVRRYDRADGAAHHWEVELA